jgi:CRP/FNR family transcriptional regulator, cyclic AMP receptor protein
MTACSEPPLPFRNKAGGSGGDVAEAKKALNSRFQEIYPDLTKIFESIATGKTLTVQKGQAFFSQGEPADAVYFLKSGKVTIASVAPDGREAVFAVLGPPAFFGETCLAGETQWVSSAIAVETSTAVRVEKRVVEEILHKHPELCAEFSTGLLVRIIRLEEDVRAQFFYDNSKKLARILLRLAQLDQHPSQADVKLAHWSHESLGKMVNASRAHITRLMNRFRKTGLIDYDRSLIVKTKRLFDVLSKN